MQDFKTERSKIPSLDWGPWTTTTSEWGTNILECFSNFVTPQKNTIKSDVADYNMFLFDFKKKMRNNEKEEEEEGIINGRIKQWVREKKRRKSKRRDIQKVT